MLRNTIADRNNYKTMTLTNKKILIVEDDPGIANSMRHSLKTMGCQISGVVQNGNDAIQKAKECLPDIVLMDIVLEGNMDGIEAGRYIQDSYNIPVLYLTGFPDKAIELEAKGKAPVLKPFSMDDLKTAIEVIFYKNSLDNGIA